MGHPVSAYLRRTMTLCLALGVMQGPHAQGLSLELFARMHMPSGKLVERSVGNDDVLRSGDEFRVRIRPAQDGFLYVLHQGTTRSMVLYPASAEAAQVGKGEQIVLPGEDNFFTLDEIPGPERVLVLVTQAPIQDMNTVLGAASASPLDPDALAAVGVGEAAEVVFRHIESASLDMEASSDAPKLDVDEVEGGAQPNNQILGDVGSRIDALLMSLDIDRPSNPDNMNEPPMDTAPQPWGESDAYTDAQGEPTEPMSTAAQTPSEQSDPGQGAVEDNQEQDAASGQVELTEATPLVAEPDVERIDEVLVDDPNDLAVVTVVEEGATVLDDSEVDQGSTSDAPAPTDTIETRVMERTDLNETSANEQAARATEPSADPQAVLYEEQMPEEQDLVSLLDDPADADRVTIVEDDVSSEASVDLAMTGSSTGEDTNAAVEVDPVGDETSTGAAPSGEGPATTATPLEPLVDQASAGETQTASTKESSAAPIGASRQAKLQWVYASAVLIPTSRGIASGVLLDTDGHILTNWHVIEDRQVIPVLVQADVSAGGAARMTTARVLGSSQVPDLALLRLETPGGALQPISVPRSLSLELGDVVYALGSANSTLSLTMVEGEIDRFAPYASWNSAGDIEHTASVIYAKVRGQPGSSGTLLLDADLRLVGIGVSADNGPEEFSAVSLDSILEFLSIHGHGNVKLSKG